jgi:hypothetical protein
MRNDQPSRRPDRQGGAPSSAAVLADRIAAALIHHEPGWRLPRLTALARRYNVSAAEVDAAIGELAARHLLRRLPDGQVYRASPAEYHVVLAGLTALSSCVDPMGGELVCRSRQVGTRRVPEDTGRALGLGPGDTAVVVKCSWLVGAEPGALSVTYLPERLAGLAGNFGASPLPEHGPVPANGGAAPGPRPDGKRAGDALAGLPRAAQVELGPPPPSVARALRLAAGQSVAAVTVRFEDPSASTPVALTMAMLRPDLFRIVVRAPGADVMGDGGFRTAWTQAAGGWEP